MTLDNVVQALTSVLGQAKNVASFKKRLDKLGITDENEYIRIVYQTIGDIIELKQTDGNKDSLSSILTQVKTNRVGWNHPMFDGVRQQLDEHDDYLVNPFEVSEGVVECTKCGSLKTFSCQKQVRKSDEPMTTFSKCVDCGLWWAYAG